MKKNSPKLIFTFLFICFNQLFITAQNIGIGTSAPATSAKLEISSTNSGLLIPRVALTMTTAAGPIAAPSISLLVYNTATAADVTPGFYYWNGIAWTRISTYGSDWNILGNSGITASNFIGSINAADFITRTTNVERMRVTAAGNVGIGDASPVALFTVGSGDLFQVLSTGHARGISGTAALPSFSFTADADNGMYLSGLNELSFSTTGAQRIVVSSSGNVGIGEVSPSALFTVGTGDLFQVVSTGQARSINGTAALPSFSFTGDSDNGMYLSATNELSFSTAAAQRMAISSGGNVGIGTSTPIYAKLQVVGNSLFTATSAAPTATTSAAYIRGNDALSTATTPDYSWYNADQTGFFHPATSVIGICTNGYGEVIRITTNRLGIGTTTPGGLLELGLDQGRKPGTNTWTIVSDERLKTIEGPYKKGLKELMQLNAIVYHYKNAEGRTFPKEVLETQNVGFSAQEVQKIFPEAVGTDSDGYLNLNNHAILIAYLNAIKEQQVEIETLKSENKTYKTELSELKKEVAEIKTLIKK